MITIDEEKFSRNNLSESKKSGKEMVKINPCSRNAKLFLRGTDQPEELLCLKGETIELTPSARSL